MSYHFLKRIDTTGINVIYFLTFFSVNGDVVVQFLIFLGLCQVALMGKTEPM